MIAITVANDSYDVPTNAADQNWAAKQVIFQQALAAAVNSALASINTLSAPLTWNDVEFENGWDNKATYQTCQYAKGVDGTVYLRGVMFDGTGVAFALSAQFRPLAKQVFAVVIEGSLGALTVNTDGTVTVADDTGGDPQVLTSLSGVSFSTL